MVKVMAMAIAVAMEMASARFIVATKSVICNKAVYMAYVAPKRPKSESVTKSITNTRMDSGHALLIVFSEQKFSLTSIL